MAAMTSLLSNSELLAGLRYRRPMALMATLGGVAAAVSTLLVAMAVGVVGWFATDAGSYGSAGDGMRTGALGWLIAHGSGVRIEGAAVTAIPLGLLLICAWTVGKIAYRVGEAVSGHGPDAAALARGERDHTVPVTVGLFTLGYVVVTVIVAALAGSATTAPSTGRAMLWSIALCLLVGGPAVAGGSGRAAVWVATLPAAVRESAALARRVLLAWLAFGAAVFVIAFLCHLSTAFNVMSQLHLGTGPALLYVLLMLAVVPNAVLFTGSYLLGPGFAVGVGTVVSPTAVTLGPVPMFPLLAALPHDGPTPWWALLSFAVAPVLTGVVVARRGADIRTGLIAGIVVGIVVGILAALAGGAVGPGRMSDIGPLAFQTLLRAVVSFALGGAAGAYIGGWLRSRGSQRAL